MRIKTENAMAAGFFLFASTLLLFALAMPRASSSYYDTPADSGASVVIVVWVVASLLIALAIYNYDVFLELWQKYKQARFDAYDPNEKERNFDLGALIPSEQRRLVAQFFEAVDQSVRATHDVVEDSDWDNIDDAQLSRLGQIASQSLLLRARTWRMTSSLQNTASLSVAALADDVIANTMVVYHYQGATLPMYVSDNVFDDNIRRQWWLRASDVLACFHVVDAEALFRDAIIEVLEPGGLRVVLTKTGAMTPAQVNAFGDACQRFVEAVVTYNQSNPDFEAVVDMLTRRLTLNHVMLWSAQSQRYATKPEAEQHTMQRTLFRAIRDAEDIRLLCAFERQMQAPFWENLTDEARREVLDAPDEALHEAFVLKLWQWLCEDLTRDLSGWLSQETLRSWFPTMFNRASSYIATADMTPSAQVMAYYMGLWDDMDRVIEALSQLSLGHRCLWFDVLWRDMKMPQRALVAQAFVPLWHGETDNAVSIALWAPKWSGDAEQTDRLLGQMLLHRTDDTQRSDTLELMQRHGAVYSLMALRYTLSQDLLSGAVEDYAEDLLERLESKYGEQANAMGQLSLSSQKAQGQLSVAEGEQGGLSEV